MNGLISGEVVRENIEWCKIWVPDSDSPMLDLPRVLLIGDSIVVGFGAEVARCLSGVASVAWIGTSRFPTDVVFRQEILLVLQHTRFDLIYFNNGLHGFRNSEESYASGLREVLRELRIYSCGAAWMIGNSTPIRVAGKLEQWHERMPRLRQRNQVIEWIAKEAEMPVVNLFSVLENHPEFHDEDGTHFNEEGRRIQAEFVARAIRRELGRGAVPKGAQNKDPQLA